MKTYNYSELLQSMCDKEASVYALIASQIDDIYDDYYKEHPFEFPINIEGLAKHLGITITYGDVNYYRIKLQASLVAQISKNENEFVVCVDKEMTDRFSRRYAIACGIAHYLYYKNSVKSFTATVSEQRLANEYTDNTAIDVITAFIIMPPKYTTEIISSYLDTIKNRHVEQDEIPAMLVDKLNFSLLHIISSWQHYRKLMCYMQSDACKNIIKYNLPKNLNNIDYVENFQVDNRFFI